MLRFWKALLLCLALAGMPLQAYVASTMAWCGHGSTEVVATAPDSHALHTASHGPGDATPQADNSCGDCAQCHLCSAHALPGVTVAPPVVAGNIHVARHAQQPGGFVPDQPRRPPLA
jgi:hypothetical protein